MANKSTNILLESLRNSVDTLASKVKDIKENPVSGLVIRNTMPEDVFTLDALATNENSGFPQFKGTTTMASNIQPNAIIGIKFSGNDDTHRAYDFSDITNTNNQWIINIIRNGTDAFENVYYDNDEKLLVRYSDTEFSNVKDTNSVVILQLKPTKSGTAYFWKFLGIATNEYKDITSTYNTRTWNKDDLNKLVRITHGSGDVEVMTIKQHNLVYCCYSLFMDTSHIYKTSWSAGKTNTFIQKDVEPIQSQTISKFEIVE